ncbi:MAG TPA: response regulator transcription factor [Acidobacteriaceae bacterium]|nr:response regulator transcription factor [Acidobacteriaceae bacterium]
MAERSLLRIMVVEDHNVVRQGLIALLRTVAGFDVIAETDNSEQAMELFRKHLPEITLMDLRLKSGSGVSAIVTIRKSYPESKIIVLTTYDGDEDIYKALQAGAQGYLLKGASSDELIKAIRAVHAGERYIPSSIAERLAGRVGSEDLTERELEVLQNIVRGKSNKEIAQQMNISEATVKTHINNLLSKLMVSDRTQAAITALQRGLVHLH